MDYVEDLERLDRAFEAGKLLDALEVAQTMLENYPWALEETSIALAQVASSLELPELALESLESAMTKGVRWAPNLLLTDAELAPLRESPRFKVIIEACQVVQDRRKNTTKPKIYLSSNSDAPSLLLGLHGRGGSGSSMRLALKPLEKFGYEVASLQSGQPFGPNGYAWDSSTQSLEEIQGAIQGLRHNRPILLAGMSQGAALALELVLSGAIEGADRFLAICPGYRTMAEIESYLPGAAFRQVRGLFICGALDTRTKETMALAERLQKAGIEVKVDLVFEMGHSIPEDLAFRFGNYQEHLAQIQALPSL